MPLQGRDKNRKERFEALAADAVRGFPEHDERLTYGGIVHPRTRTPVQWARRRRRLEQPDGVLAVVPGDRDELVQDPDPLILRADPVPVTDRL